MANVDPLQGIAAQFKSEEAVAVGKWFGKPCITTGKKVFVILWGRDLSFKLAGQAHAEALKVEGAHLFDPRGRGNPMKEWVQIPSEQSSTWGRFARLAYDTVASSSEE